MNIKTNIKKLLLSLSIIGTLITLAACSESDVASVNVSNDADNFKAFRKVTVINNIKGEKLFTVEGIISIHVDKSENQLEILEKKDKTYKKHFIGLSDNTSYLVEDLTGNKNIDTNHFKITYNPSVVIPDLENTHQ